MDLVNVVLAMPKDVNTQGDIFGGWILCIMDHAGVIHASKHIASHCKVVTVKIKEMNFKSPVKVGDIVKCYAETSRVGNSSLDVTIKVMAHRDHGTGPEELVTEGIFTYVSLSKATNKPHKVYLLPLDRTLPGE